MMLLPLLTALMTPWVGQGDREPPEFKVCSARSLRGKVRQTLFAVSAFPKQGNKISGVAGKVGASLSGQGNQGESQARRQECGAAVRDARPGTLRV